MDRRSGSVASPKIQTISSYSSPFVSPERRDVLVPAAPLRTVRLPVPMPLDISLERQLKRLQRPSGAFPLSPELAGALGVPMLLSKRGFVDADRPELMATLLALEAVAVFQPERRGDLDGIYLRALSFCSRELGTTDRQLDGLLEALHEASAEEATRLPPWAQAVRSIFVKDMFTSFAVERQLIPGELWTPGSPGFLCPAFVLVDFASALWSPHSIDRQYILVRHGKTKYIGTLRKAARGGDALRQGLDLESKIVSHSDRAEDVMIRQLDIGPMQVFYMSAPDAVEEEFAVEESVISGYSSNFALDRNFSDLHRGGVLEYGMFRGRRGEAGPARYVEIKKTTHLFGRSGGHKKLKYWLQAVLGGCASVLVAMTHPSAAEADPARGGAGSGDRDIVSSVVNFTVQRLERDVLREFGIVPEDIFGHLQDVLSYLDRETSAAADDGRPWVLRLKKEKGTEMNARLELTSDVHDRQLMDAALQVHEMLSMVDDRGGSA